MSDTDRLCEFGYCTGGDTPQHHTIACYLGEDTEK